MCYSVICFSWAYKKAGLTIVFRFSSTNANICANKKSGTACCCSALRGSGIALLFRTSNTEVHAEYVRTRVYLYKYTRHKIYISWGHQLLQCLGIKIEFTRFRKAKNKALRTPFRHKGKVARFDAYILKCRKPYWGLFQTSWLSERGHFPPSKPRRWTFGYKITTFFAYMQEKSQKLLKLCDFYV